MTPRPPGRGPQAPTGSQTPRQLSHSGDLATRGAGRPGPQLDPRSPARPFTVPVSGVRPPPGARGSTHRALFPAKRASCRVPPGQRSSPVGQGPKGQPSPRRPVLPRPPGRPARRKQISSRPALGCKPPGRGPFRPPLPARARPRPRPACIPGYFPLLSPPHGPARRRHRRHAVMAPGGPGLGSVRALSGGGGCRWRGRAGRTWARGDATLSGRPAG